jgi:hypothetical protein
MEKMSWIGHLRNGEVVQRVQEKRSILQTIKRRKSTLIGYILSKNCHLKQVIGVKMEGMEEERNGRNYGKTRKKT